MDYMFYYAYLDNTLGFRDFMAQRAPGMFAFRPLRIVSDMQLPSGFDGNTETNAFFGEVVEWYPEEGLLGVLPYAEVGRESYYYVDVNSAKIVIPAFDEVSQPLPKVSVDTSFATQEEWDNFILSFETDQEYLDFIKLAEEDEAFDLTSFVASNFGGTGSELQTFREGPYTWDTAFCLEDIVLLGFAKDVEIVDPSQDVPPKASVAVVDLSTCPLTDKELTQ